MSAAQQLQGFLERTPYVRFLGFRAELEGDALTGILPFSEPLVGNTFIPALHGGVIGAFLEMTALAQLFIVQPPGPRPKTIDVTIEYLRPGRAWASPARRIATSSPAPSASSGRKPGTKTAPIRSPPPRRRSR